MDILSHGLWGGIAFGRKNKKDFWWSFVLGILPDFLSFGILTVATTWGLSSHPDWGGHPQDMAIPLYIHSLYNITHSLVIFGVVFGVVYLIRKKPFWPMLAWGLHVLVDIPTHSTEFFATPFLWPFSAVRFNGISWSHLIIFLPNVILLLALYTWFFVSKKYRKR